MSFDQHKNFAYSTVQSGSGVIGSSSSTSLTIASSGDLPDPSLGQYNITVWPASQQPSTVNAEIMRVTAKSGTTLTVTRAQEGTSALTAIAAGYQVALTMTSKLLTDLEAGPALVGASVTRTATQSISNSTETAMQFTAEDWDSNNFHDNATNNSRLTVPTGLGGYYLMTSWIPWPSGSYRRFIDIWKNSQATGKLLVRSDSSGNTGEFSQAISIMEFLVAGDYVELYVWQGSGGSVNVDGGANLFPRFQIQRLSPG